MKRRIEAIIGAIAGDIIGSAYEFRGVEPEMFRLFDEPCSYTDDTVLTVAVADWLATPGSELRDFLIRYAHKYYDAGFGPHFARWCMKKNPQPYYSCGNGSAMRVSAVGCMANSVEEAMRLAKESAMPTHNHPEGIKGAQAIAVAVVLARQSKTKEEIKKELQGLFDYDLTRSYQDLYEGDYVFNVLCQTTVPEALISFFESESYEDCIFKAVLTNKDTDTAAAVAGAVAGAYYGVPDEIKTKAMSYLPQEMVEVLGKLEKKLLTERSKKIIYLHGYGSSSQSGTVRFLQKQMPECMVLAPDIPVEPKEALPFLRGYCERMQPDVIVGTSMGAMYAMQMYGYKRICVNPALRMSDLKEVLKVGTFEYFQPTLSGKTHFTITEDTIEQFREMEAHMFDGLDDESRRRCWGFFGDEDTTVNWKDEFTERVSQNVQMFHGGHRMNNTVLHDVIVPAIASLLA
ncbi:MAG: ADP-ribosylglycohydrolase family protein [Bacteroidaceae bacterium]|nr:ADP-ribosylglycohydrolase family protein [Bacteroidaceae bacterium]